MGNILGLDLGTNSLGLSIRNIDNGNNLKDQLDYFSSIIFKSGIGRGKTGEFSYAAERTKHRSVRRLYQARKYRLWETLSVLIEYGYCPLSKIDLDRWCKYDKRRELKRQYPINSIEFEQWIRLDFDGDGKSDYSSPYQLRAELMNRQFNFTHQMDQYKLGRALYHIAQRRGFKSSKGEMIKEQGKVGSGLDIENEIDISEELKKSEEKKSKDLVYYMKTNNLPTVGCAFAHIENSKKRIRNSEYQAVRSQYKEEIKAIFEFQEGLDINSEFHNRIISEKEGEGSIFYKRPLRSQKNSIGKCTLEPNKPRCPISHPEFEKFRAWCFINNIKYRTNVDNKDWLELTVEQKNKLYQEKFLRTIANFRFEEIKKWMIKEIDHNFDYDKGSINYKDKTNVSGCPICGRLRNLLGNDWENIVLNKERINPKTGELYKVTYNAEDIWHICFSFDEAENIEELAKETLKFNEYETKQLVRIWSAISQGYSMLSLKAIKNINHFLQKGLVYTDAVLLAKLPDIMGENLWQQSEEIFISRMGDIFDQSRKEKRILNIANNLIANYKSLDETEQFAYKNTEYELDNSDYREIEKYVNDSYGEKTWTGMLAGDRKEILSQVEILYQRFFSDENRNYFILPKLGDSVKRYLSDNFDFLHCANGFMDKDNKSLPCSCSVCKKLSKLYHPSMIEFYKPSKEKPVTYDGVILSKKLLESPVIRALKNPMAMRVLHILRNQINSLLLEGIIDVDTRVVVETARELNDANMRWAIETYQREREKENKEFEKAIREHFPDRSITDDDIDKTRLLVDQQDIPARGWENSMIVEGIKKKKKIIDKIETYKKDVTKYRLWLEQGCRCIYTGKLINITTLLSDEDKIDIEHTIPRSISFDNSLANLTICDKHFNRAIKKNRIPAQLDNYDDILVRIQPWIEKVDKLKDSVEFWKSQSRRAQEKGRKDYCIRQRHLWQMELDYWSKKVERFTMKEVTSGFRNSQLNDTRIITKYAYHYLKSVFNKVEVQKGSVTADFRKMLGIQSIEEKKNRDRHSHHAIDATILTLIPTAAKRDRMLELFYKMQEEKHLGNDVSYWQMEFEKEKKGFSDISNIARFIEENIIINHTSHDQVLTPAKRRMQKVSQKENGHDRWTTGDCIRGKLHGETFYGAIKLAQKDENGRIVRDESGNMQIGQQVYYVLRRELKYKKDDNDSGFKSWEEIERVIVDKALLDGIKKQFPEGISFKEACEQGIYMFDKKGNKFPIRRIRCQVSVQNPLKIKRQTYLSTKEHKQYYYAGMGDLYVMCCYESKDSKTKEFRIWNLFDVCENRKSGIDDIPKEIQSNKKEKKLYLSRSLKENDMILIYKERKEELFDMDSKDLANRLYVIRGFENDGNRIILRKSINAQQDKELGKGASIKDFDEIPEKIRCGIGTLKFIQKGVDFEILVSGKINFK